MKGSHLRLAAIVPTLDEEASLARNLPALLATVGEVIVVDGGSRDGTAEAARRLGARVIASPPGRGVQLNRGAAATDAELLLFLHADTRLPDGAAAEIHRAVAAGAVGGAFYVRFDDPRPILRFGARLINLRTRLLTVPLGDQAQFVTRESFDRLGGFREWPILEDLDLIRRLRRQGKITIVPRPVTTSARRFVQRGVVRTVATNWLIWLLFFCGLSPHRLVRLYRHIR